VYLLMYIRNLLLVVLACAMFGAQSVHAAATVVVTRAAENSYVVSVTNVDNAAAIDFSLNYDAVSLSLPQITDGPVALTAKAIKVENIATPGIVRVVYLVANGSFKEGGVLATVNFTKTGAAQVQPPELKSDVITQEATRVATQSVVFPQSVQAGAVQDSSLGGNAATVGATGQSSHAVTTGTGSMSSVTSSVGGVSGGQEQKNEPYRDDQQRSTVSRDYQVQNQKTGEQVVASATVAPIKNDEVAPVKNVAAKLPPLNSLPGVLELFRTYKGPRTLRRLAELFDRSGETFAAFTQSPPISVSDGKSSVLLTISLPDSSTVPSFSFKGAHLKGLRHPSPQQWELEALPSLGKFDVRLSVLLQGSQVELPLVVVPPLDPVVAKELGGADFAVESLLARTPAKSAKLPFDLNVDGKQDFIDDYILVAHWLLKQQKTEKASAKNPPRPANP